MATPSDHLGILTIHPRTYIAYGRAASTLLETESALRPTIMRLMIFSLCYLVMFIVAVLGSSSAEDPRQSETVWAKSVC